MKPLFLRSAMIGLGIVALSVSSSAQATFPPVDTSFNVRTVVVPASPVKMKTIFVGGKDTVMSANGTRTLAKQWHDFIGYTPINSQAPSDSGWVTVNHEMKLRDDILGDGGGMTVFKVKRQSNGDYTVDGGFRNVDFSAVGNTVANCGGINTLDGRIWTAEEWQQASNADINIGLYPLEGTDTSLVASGAGISFGSRNGLGIRDTSDWTIPQGSNFAGRSIKKFHNFNWLVEIDPAQAKAVRKMYNWGRFEHEGGVVMPDNKTVYLTDDFQPSIFFKFVAQTAGEFNQGTLYAYKQSADGQSGSWVEIEQSFDSLVQSRNVAIRKGATMFTRFEWIEQVNGKVYITETGRDNSGNVFKDGIRAGANLAKHLMDRDVYDGPFPDSTTSRRDTVIQDYYGRVLVFDPATEKMSVYLEGGKASNYSQNKVHLSNPDGLVHWRIMGKDLLVIQEDLNGRSKGRVGNPDVDGSGNNICEMYVLDMGIPNPTLNDLRRLMILPNGAEVTGARPTPDGKAMFVNSQHPSRRNTGDFANSCTILLTGLDQLVTNVYDEPVFENNTTFQIYPNPASRVLHFNKTTDVAIYTVTGVRVRVARNTNTIDIADLTSGIYFVQTIDGAVQKLVIE